jgi:hypothetical protein
MLSRKYTGWAYIYFHPLNLPSCMKLLVSERRKRCSTPFRRPSKVYASPLAMYPSLNANGSWDTFADKEALVGRRIGEVNRVLYAEGGRGGCSRRPTTGNLVSRTTTRIVQHALCVCLSSLPPTSHTGRRKLPSSSFPGLWTNCRLMVT